MGINGANGMLYFDGKIVVSSNRYHPQMNSEDVIISNGIPITFDNISHSIDKYICCCMDKKDYDLKETIAKCNCLLETLNKTLMIMTMF